MKSKKTARDICKMFGVAEMFDLRCLFSKKEQAVFKSTRRSRHFSYDRSTQLHVRIVRSLKCADMKSWHHEDVIWARVIIWLYHHHMISVALNRCNMKSARYHADVAMKLNFGPPDSQLTIVLWHLVHGRVARAKRYCKCSKLPDRDTSAGSIAAFELGWGTPRFAKVSH